MNNRQRQIVKAQIALVKTLVVGHLRPDGCKWSYVVLIPRDELGKYKAEYGDALTVWE